MLTLRHVTLRYVRVENRHYPNVTFREKCRRHHVAHLSRSTSLQGPRDWNSFIASRQVSSVRVLLAGADDRT